MIRRIMIAEFPSLVGKELGVSRWYCLDLTRIDRFAELTEDRQWIHVDTERAKRAGTGTIAHGFLSLSMLSAMVYDIWEAPEARRLVNYGFNRVRFTDAVPAGTRIRLREKLLSAEPKAGGFLVTCDCVVEIEHQDRPALVCEWLGLIFANA
jgi:acyl dehydratase